MNPHFKFKTSLVIVALLSFSAAQGATISKADYKTEKARISASYKADKLACASFSANAKDVCMEEAKAKEKVAHAELKFSHSGKASDQTKVLKAKAKSSYEVAKEKCKVKAGNDKDVCVKEAKAIETAALADANLGKQIDKAKKDAAADINDANYKVALEKCDALAGQPKDSCVAAAKTLFAK
ncbi:hypothetical protein GALL_452490 [mine drainage metagenome]|uniref:Uncharacterized protein n=1 Tax=mine drainage metagenome TaxID=410659 RepID=A0A1J5QAW5_9ZZZZ